MNANGICYLHFELLMDSSAAYEDPKMITESIAACLNIPRNSVTFDTISADADTTDMNMNRMQRQQTQRVIFKGHIATTKGTIKTIVMELYDIIEHKKLQQRIYDKYNVKLAEMEVQELFETDTSYYQDTDDAVNDELMDNPYLADPNITLQDVFTDLRDMLEDFVRDCEGDINDIHNLCEKQLRNQ